ncbi:MAG: 30S ribosomal protein S4 [SAR324 cluster bacterium]|nr:30S ribosomal protein S4 [SAR324 cluster bacterium]
MSRKSIPRHRICRRLGVSVCGAVNCPLGRRPTPPGQHGAMRRSKDTQYALQLKETQKLRAYYGVSSKQLRRYYAEAATSKEQTNIALVQKMECRLDNMAYRMGFACSLRSARQLVVHRHLMVNGKNVNKPSYQLKSGDTVQLREKSQKIERYTEWFKFYDHKLSYVQKDVSKYSGSLVEIPTREEIPILVEDQLVVEFMAR